MAGFVRQSTYVDGDTIQASDSNDEFNQLLTAFVNTTGHAHDGTAAEGPVIGLIGDPGVAVPLNKVVVSNASNRVGVFVDVASAAVEQIRFADGIIAVVTDNDIDLGASGAEFKDGWFDGTVYTDTLSVGDTDTIVITDNDFQVTGALTFDVSGDITLDADGGDVFFADAGVTFGSATNTAGNLIVKSGTTTALTFSGANVTAAGSITSTGGGSLTGTWSDLGTVTTVDINGGTADAVVIGGASAAAATVTTLVANTSLVLNASTALTSVDTDLTAVSAAHDTLTTALATKTYVDAQVTASDLDFSADSGGALSIDLDSEALTLTGGTGIDTTGLANDVSFAIDSTVATLTGSQTLTNKTINLTSNTLAATSLQIKTAVTDETGSGALVFATSPTLVTPALGTPASGVMTNTTGTASGLTAGNVTTNANITGHVTSVGNASVLGSFTLAQLNTAVSDATLVDLDNSDTLTNKVISLTSNTLTATSLELKTAISDETGSGALVFATSPSLVTPLLGTPTSGVATNLTGTASGLTAGNVTTNANLTGHITSVGNAAVLGSFTSAQLLTALTDETGTGAAVFGTSPTLTTPTIDLSTVTSTGDLAIADGGTGSSTAIAARAALDVDQAGTAIAMSIALGG